MMTRFTLCCLMCAFLACSGLQMTTTSEAAKQAFQEGIRLEKKNELRKSVEAYKQAIREDERFLEAYEALGRVYEMQGLFKLAADPYQSALQIDPNRTSGYLSLGRALFNAERYEDAIRPLQQYVVFQPADREGLELLAETQRIVRHPSAERTFHDLVSMDTSDVSALRGLAHYYYSTRDYDRALPYYRRAVLGKNPDRSVTTLYEFAYCLVRQSLWDEASTYLQAAILQTREEDVVVLDQTVRKVLEKKFQPDALMLYLDARLALEESTSGGERSMADVITLAQQSLRIEPSFIPSQKLSARLLYNLGEYDKALPHYETIIAEKAATAEDYTNAGYIHFRQDDLKQARTYYRKAYTMNPDLSYIESYLSTIDRIEKGEIHRESYRWYEKAVQATDLDSASRFLDESIRIDSLWYEPYLQRGAVTLRQGDWKRAEGSFETALRFAQEPKTQSLLQYNLGLVYINRDLHDKAIARFRKAIELDPTDPDPHYQLSQVYLDKSDMESAIRSYDELLALRPAYYEPREEELVSVGLTDAFPVDESAVIRIGNQLSIGQTHTYEARIVSQGDALLGVDADGKLARDVRVKFRVQVEDVTSYGVTEFSLDILRVEGSALTAAERKTIGKRFYLRVSDVYGVVNIYGLLEDQPYSLSRLVINIMSDLYGGFLRKEVSQGEMWRATQIVFKLGSVDGVSVLENVGDRSARQARYYAVSGSYNAARYGEQGQVHVFNRGTVESEFDRRQHLVTYLKNQFTTKQYREASGKVELQVGSYEVRLRGNETFQVEPPKRVVISEIPYVKQHGPQCAAASLSMVLSYYKKEIDQDDIYAAIKSDYAGAQSHDIVQYPRSLSYKTFGYIGNLEDLKSRVDQGIPALVFLSPFGFGHVVVVIGYDESKHQIIMHDPTVANNHAVGYDEFLAEWRQSGNECAIVVPFDREMQVTEGALASHVAVEMKWKADKVNGDKQYDQAIGLYREALRLLPNYDGALEGVMRVHLARDQFDKASAILDTLLSWDPNSIDLVLQNASILLSQYDYDKVLQITKKAKQLDEMNINTYVYSAIALSSQKKYQEAIDEIKRGLRINPLVSTPRQILAGFLAEVEDFEQAYEQANLAIRYEPDNVGNFMTLSGVYLNEINYRFLTGHDKESRLRKMIDLYDRIRETNPKFPSLDQLYGDAYLLADRFAAGDSLMRENIRKFPEDESSYNNLAWFYATEGIRLAEAEKLSEKSIELSQRNPYYFDTMGWIHFKMALAARDAGKKDSSEQYFLQAEKEMKATIEYDKYSDFAYRHLGVIYESWGKRDLANEQFDKAIGLVPVPTRVCIEIAQDLEEAGLPERGIEFYERAHSLGSKIPYASYRLAILLAEQGKDLTRAMEYAEAALTADSTSSLYQGAKGIVHYARKQYVEAARWLEKAVSNQSELTDRETADNHYYLGMVYRQRKDLEKSQTQFRESIRRYPYGNRVSEMSAYLK